MLKFISYLKNDKAKYLKFLSVILYLTSIVTDVLLVSNRDGLGGYREDILGGYEILSSGWAKSKTIIPWSSNLLYFILILFDKILHKPFNYILLFFMLIAATFTFAVDSYEEVAFGWKHLDIMYIEKYLLGFYLWTSSYLLILIYNLVRKRKTKSPEEVTVNAGEQIQVGESVISLFKTSIDEILEEFELEDNFGIFYSHWDDVDMETGQFTYSYEFEKNIHYKGIDFEFKGKSKDSLTLEWIRIKQTDYLDVKVNDKISLGDTNPSVDKYFGKHSKYDYISDDSLTYNLFSQGISFQFKQKGLDRILKEVSIHYKIEEEENN